MSHIKTYNTEILMFVKLHESMLTLLHSEWPKHYKVLAILSALGLRQLCEPRSDCAKQPITEKDEMLNMYVRKCAHTVIFYIIWKFICKVLVNWVKFIYAVKTKKQISNWLVSCGSGLEKLTNANRSVSSVSDRLFPVELTEIADWKSISEYMLHSVFGKGLIYRREFWCIYLYIAASLFTKYLSIFLDVLSAERILKQNKNTSEFPRINSCYFFRRQAHSSSSVRVQSAK